MSSTRLAARSAKSTPPANGSDAAHNSVVLGPRDRLVGQLHIEGDIRVVGTVEGELDVTGNVEIDDGGRVTGPVTARNRLVVGPGGSLVGDVRVARLVVQDGATFSGNVSMGPQLAPKPKPAEVVQEPERVKALGPVVPPVASKGPAPTKSPEKKAKRR